MKVQSLENKSSPVWPLLFLACVFLSFSLDSQISNENLNYSIALERSLQLFKDQNYVEALDIAEDLHKKFPNNPFYLQLLSQIYAAIGDTDNQARVQEIIIRTMPAAVVQEICPSQIPAGNRLLLEKCIQRLPDDPDTLLKLSQTEKEKRRQEDTP